MACAAERYLVVLSTTAAGAPPVHGKGPLRRSTPRHGLSAASSSTLQPSQTQAALGPSRDHGRAVDLCAPHCGLRGQPAAALGRQPSHQAPNCQGWHRHRRPPPAARSPVPRSRRPAAISRHTTGLQPSSLVLASTVAADGDVGEAAARRGAGRGGAGEGVAGRRKSGACARGRSKRCPGARWAATSRI